jgi:hypothetical protein
MDDEDGFTQIGCGTPLGFELLRSIPRATRFALALGYRMFKPFGLLPPALYGSPAGRSTRFQSSAFVRFTLPLI